MGERSNIAPLAFSLGLALSLASNQCLALPRAQRPALSIDDQGCHFGRYVTRALRSLPQHSDMQMHTEKRAARFAFEDLHGVAVATSWDAEWTEARLYFREDLPTLIATLERLGFQVDARGSVAIPAGVVDDMALSVEAKAYDAHEFIEARSYLACGGV